MIMVEFSYIHIPFCKQKCKYCGFTSFINLNFIDKYVDKLLIEIENLYKGEPQKTLYFGGGTPSLLKIEQVKKIISKFSFIDNPEITFEINPENSDSDYLKGLLDNGINRLSIGTQTFNDKILNNIGRIHNSKCAINAINSAKKAGFKNISIDLMYGLPNQTIKNLEADLEIANNLNIEHISTYGLKIEEKTYFDKFKPENLPNEEIQADMYKLIIEKLTNFSQYEISNFAKTENFQSLHNLNYWNINPYYGFGISASGFDGISRYKNTENIKEYLINPLKKDEITPLSDENLLEESVFLGFRKTEGINIKEINDKFNIDFNQKYKTIIEKYLNSKHILKTEKGYRLSTDGILISNYILCDFLCVI